MVQNIYPTYFPLPLSFKINVMGFKKKISGFFSDINRNIKKESYGNNAKVSILYQYQNG